MTKKIKFSVIIPVRGKYTKRIFNGCEVIYVNKLSKSAARNYGASIAHGNYLIHIDRDNEVPSNVIDKARNLILKNGYKTIVLEEYINKSENPWSNARMLERVILSGNKTLSTPQIINKKLFNDIGGYDERFNELDDWALQMRLKSKNIKPAFIPHATAIFEPSNILEIVKRRFRRGQELRYFKEVYGSIPQLNLSSVHKSYKSRIYMSPFIFHLLILKFFDFIALMAGSLFPVRSKISELYMEKITAEGFDMEQKSFYGKIKHLIELKNLLRFLGKSRTVLDLGAGTGRMTAELTKRGFRVTPADVSAEMLKKIPGYLPRPVLLRNDRLPFRNDSFDTVISIRVIWHLKDSQKRERFFSEAARVAKKYVIMDFSFLSSAADHQFSMPEINKIARKYKLTITGKAYLPLGRILIKFSKR